LELAGRVENGMSASFWTIKWRGDMSFRLKYPIFYSISNQKEACVGEIGLVNGLEWERASFCMGGTIFEERI